MEGNRIQEAQELSPFKREFGPMLPSGFLPDYPCPVWVTSGHDISVKTITLKSNNHLYATNTYILSNKLFFLFDESRLLNPWSSMVSPEITLNHAKMSIP